MMTARGKQLNEAKPINLDRCYAESDRQMEVGRRQQALLAAAGMDGPVRRWAIVKVAPNRENDVDKSLSAALIEHWLPLRKADKNVGGRRTGSNGDAIWVLAWPGYIFVKVPDLPEAWAGIATVKHTLSVLGADERPFFIDDATMLKIKAELSTLKDLPRNAGTMFAKGDKVRVEEGPFASFPATIDEIGKDGRARVEVMIFGRMSPVELDLAQLAKS
ncbi:transcription termination/antitermination protein NusG [Mesorhizobium xinjiangense]|uniref:transcription termination/antitermination protein NusG n=1 Tax=Mesorhizobium xinjiangense TaxID=2678685 RepID=UPI0012EE3ED3|nr:transcription termination/antitermination NusG family protein [Mesorhizobium xinjiangense]